MSQKSRAKQLKRAEETGNYTGLPGHYKKTTRRPKVALRTFRDGRLGTVRNPKK